MGDKENSGGENITRAEAKAATAQQPADLLANFKSVAAASAAQLVGVLKEQGSMAGVRADKEVLYATIEDFARVDPNARRVVVIGCTGSGKSTMLNTMAGWKFVQRAPDYKYTWERGDADGTPLFEARASSDSVTKKTTYANLEWFGDASRPFVAVDTPGHDDPAGSEIDSPEAREVLGELAADLHNKLKALRHVHAIVVLHNDILSNRLNPATCAARAILGAQFSARNYSARNYSAQSLTPNPHLHRYTILKMVSEKFAKAETSVWKNVVVAYSKCNAHETSWRSELASKKAKMQASAQLWRNSTPRLAQFPDAHPPSDDAGDHPREARVVRHRRPRPRARRRHDRPEAAVGGDDRRLRGALGVCVRRAAARHDADPAV